MSDWQPIETAPENKPLLVLRRDGVMHVATVSGLFRKFAHLSADFGNASCSFFFPVSEDSDADDTPTHWMALPPPPTDSTPTKGD